MIRRHWEFGEGRTHLKNVAPLPKNWNKVMPRDRTAYGNNSTRYAVADCLSKRMIIKPKMRLTVGKSIVANVVAGRVCKDKEDHDLSCRQGARRNISLLSNSPATVTAQQCKHASQVHLTSCKSSNKKRCNCGVDELPAILSNVEFSLEVWVRVANTVQNVAQVVADQGVAAPLGEKSKK